MIYITGDMHGDIESFSRKKIKKLKKEDILIICGDFGFVWNESKEEKRYIDEISKMKFKILFVDGTHENFDLLYNYPIETLYGGKVHRISKNIYHLIRGQIFEIEGKKLFAFGGGESQDKELRKEFGTWDRREMPTIEEMKEGVEILNEFDKKVDYIITHEPPNWILNSLGRDIMINSMSAFFNTITENVKYDCWYFGSIHIDKIIGSKYRAIFKDVVKI